MAVTALSLLFLGLSFFSEDKGSYLLNYNLLQVVSSSSSVENQIKKVELMTRLMHEEILKKNSHEIINIFNEQSKSLKLKSLLVLRLSKDGVFKEESLIGDEDHSLLHVLDQLGWNSERFFNDPVLVAKAPSGELALGTFFRFSDGGGTAYLVLLNPDLNAPQYLPDYFNIFLVNSLGDALYSTQKSTKFIGRSEILDILKPVLENRIVFGIRKWNSEHDHYLVAYQQLSVKELAVVGMVSEKAILSSSRILIFSFFVISSSFIFITIGFVLVFLKRIIEGLSTMLAITVKIKEGNFSFRLDTKRMHEDEIGALATSFNLMAGKIDQLVSEAVHQVEVRNDQEILAIVQNKFIPQLPLNLPLFSFSGKSIFSRQWGGGLVAL